MRSLILRRGLSALSLIFLVSGHLVSLAFAAPFTDTDGDGLYDDDELAYGFDPTNPDENSNGILDGLDDTDDDGIKNSDEVYFTETDPTNADTDGDTRSDGFEVSVGTDPLVAERADMNITNVRMDETTREIYYTVSNLGDLDVNYLLDRGYNSIRIDYDSTDGTYTAGYYDQWDTEIPAGTWSGDFLLPGGSEEIASGVILDSGEHSVLVCTSPASAHGDTISSSLEPCELITLGGATTSTDLPDLVTESITYDPDLNVFVFNIKNKDLGSVSDDLDPDYNVYIEYLADGEVFDGSYLFNASFNLDEQGTTYREPGGVMSFTSDSEFTISTDLCAAYVYGIVDGNGEVLESDDFNDFRTFLDLCPEPESGPEDGLNLNVTNLRMDEDFARLLWNVNMEGSGDLGEEIIVRVQVFVLNSDGSLGAEVFDKYKMVDLSALESDGIDPMSQVLTKLEEMAGAYAAGLIPGDFLVSVTVDYWAPDEENGRVLETNEADNTETLEIHLSDWVNLGVAGGDLTEVPSFDGFGTAWVFPYMLYNDSLISVPSSVDSWNQFSLDGVVIDTQIWELIPEDENDFFTAGMNSESAYVLDTYLSVGSHVFEVCTDGAGLIYEKDETDNCVHFDFVVSSSEGGGGHTGGHTGGHGAGGTASTDPDTNIPDTNTPNVDPDIVLTSEDLCMDNFEVSFQDLNGLTEEQELAICTLQSEDVIHGYDLSGESFGQNNAALFYEFAKIWARSMGWITEGAETVENDTYMETLVDKGIFSEDQDMTAEMTGEDMTEAFNNYGLDVSDYDLDTDSTVERANLAVVFYELFFR